MSIINDALKKAHQGLSRKADETRNTPADVPVTSDYIYSQPQPTQLEDKSAAKNGPHAKKKSALSLILAIAFAAGAIAFLWKQLDTYSPHFTKTAKSFLFKLIHAEQTPARTLLNPAQLVPLATIAAVSSVPAVNAPKPLKIHGVMSNASGNIVLINDQVYQEGDAVDGVKIVKIDLNAIKVIRNGKEEIIPVNN